MQFYFQPGGNQTLEIDTIRAFTDMYPESVTSRFYIYDTFTNRYVETITNPRDGVISKKPALFRSLNEHKFEFQDKDEDIRGSSILERIYENILISVLRDSEYIHRKLIAQDNVQYKVVPFSKLSSIEFKKYCGIEYKDYKTNAIAEMEGLIRTACQLFSIYPGRTFYIYDFENKSICKHMTNNTVAPIEFMYLNGSIVYDIPATPDLDQLIKDVVMSIYRDFVIECKYPTKYKFIRKDNIGKHELQMYLKEKTESSIIEDIFTENHIQKENEYWNHFYLRTCVLDKNSWNVLVDRSGNNITFIEFMYSKDDGLVATNVGILDIDVNTLVEMEHQIIDGTLVPIDIDEWNKHMEAEGKLSINLEPYKIKAK